MDRQIVYIGQLPQDTDILNVGLNSMVGQGFLNQALLGSSTVVAGLACTPTAPASLVVNVGVGSIYQIDPIDASSYGSIGPNSNNILKQGILATAQSLTLTPPATTGFSQVYLVQAELQDVDTGPQVLSYFNSANPAQPFSGPANSGSSQFTVRSCKCTVALKAGVAATTGTQVTPSPDAGFVGLYAITVANGATQVVSNNIAQLAAAPFFPTLPQVPYDVQQQNYSYAGQDTGAANAYVITFAPGQPQPASYKAGMRVVFKALNANTGASTINVNGLGAVAIRRATGVALSAADINSGQVVELTYDGTVFQMVNYLGAGATSNTTTAVNIPYVADTGAQNAIVATFSPAITSGQQIAGLTIEVKLANTVTGACTINVNGLGLKNLKTGDLQNPPNGLFVAGEVLLLVYDGTQYQVVNSTSLIYRKPAANLTIFVNGGTGSDTLYDGTSATVGSGTSGPVATISKAVLIAFSYAPSQFTITIQVAAGTYNESVVTPLYAGPNIIINGAGASSTAVNAGASSAITVQGPNTMTCTNISAQTSLVYPNTGFAALSGAVMICSNTASGNVGAAVFYANDASLTVNGNHTFNGNSVEALFWGIFGGVVGIQTAVFTFSTSISVPLGVAVASGSGSINVNNVNPPTFVNPSFVNGPKYFASLNGTINVNNPSIVFPGNSPGTTATGGQYS